MQHGFLVADDQGMAGIVAALETHHRAGTVGQQVDDLALAFIPPLGPDYDDALAHVFYYQNSYKKRIKPV